MPSLRRGIEVRARQHSVWAKPGFPEGLQQAGLGVCMEHGVGGNRNGTQRDTTKLTLR